MNLNDDLRSLPQRYLGYSKIVALILQPFVPNKLIRSSRLVWLGTTFRTVYIGMDTFQKAAGAKSRSAPKTHNLTLQSGVTRLTKDIPPMAVAIGDSLMWHGIASVFLPRTVISECGHLIHKFVRIPYVSIPAIPAILTLLLLPATVEPLDIATNLFMDTTYRKILGKTY